MFLLDTCTLLWLAGGLHDRLSQTVVASIERHAGLVFVSAISAFEIGVKHNRRKLELPMEARTWFRRAVETHGLHEVAVNGNVAAASTMLPAIHSDPCDRILVATAQEYGFTVLTPDDVIASYPGVETLW